MRRRGPPRPAGGLPPVQPVRRPAVRDGPLRVLRGPGAAGGRGAYAAYVKRLAFPDGRPYLSGLVRTPRHDYFLRGDAATGATLVRRDDPATYPKTPPPLAPPDDGPADEDPASTEDGAADAGEQRRRRRRTVTAGDPGEARLRQRAAVRVEEELERRARARRLQTDNGTVIDVMVRGAPLLWVGRCSGRRGKRGGAPRRPWECGSRGEWETRARSDLRSNPT